jgi:hypothetical protein
MSQPVDVAALRESIKQAAATIMDMNKAVGNPLPPGCGDSSSVKARGGTRHRRRRNRRTHRR